MGAEGPREVIWAESAVRDLEEIVAFVARESRAAAERTLGELRSRAESLTVQSRRGRVVPELLQLGVRAWRELIVRPYRLIYRITDGTVIVLAVFDGHRDLEDLLLERLLRDA